MLRKKAKAEAPWIKFEKKIYILPQYERITKGRIFMEYEDGRIRKIDEKNIFDSDQHLLDDAKRQMKFSENIFQKNKDHIKIRILSPFELEFSQNTTKSHFPISKALDEEKKESEHAKV